MTANDWLVIQRARARRDGVRLGALLATPIALALGVVIMVAVHIGLSAYADRKHDEVVAALEQANTILRADVARYSEIAELEKAYAAREAGR